MVSSEGIDGTPGCDRIWELSSRCGACRCHAVSEDW